VNRVVNGLVNVIKERDHFPDLNRRLPSESVNARSVVRIVEQGRTHRRVRLAEGGNEGRHSPLGVAAVMARYEARDSLQFSSFACRYLFI
jgi:hypothetical protein